MSLGITRNVVRAIHSGELREARFQTDPVFGFRVFTQCPRVDAGVLNPRDTWSDTAAYDQTRLRLAGLFQENFRKYESGVSAAVRSAGPQHQTPSLATASSARVPSRSPHSPLLTPSSPPPFA
jgi:phosphoenolpyruvate carboxykinase (ATP)